MTHKLHWKHHITKFAICATCGTTHTVHVAFGNYHYKKFLSCINCTRLLATSAKERVPRNNQ